MLRQSAISIRNSLSTYRFQQSPKPTYPFRSKSLTTLSNQYLYPSSSPQKPSKRPLSLHALIVNSQTRSSLGPNLRNYCVDTNKVVDSINLKFAEAREEIEAAMESKETVYFDEEAECARDAVKEVLEMYEGLLAKLPEKEKMVIQRSMGLKIEQLKAELEQLND